MDRIVTGRKATISVLFSRDGTAVDPDGNSATVQIDRYDGTELVAETAATRTGTGAFSYELVPTALDLLTATWTATFDGDDETVETQVEVAGGVYFTVQEFNVRYTDHGKTAAEVRAARTLAEDAYEQASGVAYVPRLAFSERASGLGGGSLILRWPRIRSVTTLSIGGTAFTSDQIAGLQHGTSSVLGYSAAGGSFTAGNGNVLVTYEHGYDRPPSEVKDAVMILARDKLVQGPVSDRRTALPTEAGGVISLARPGIDANHPFGIDQVDAVYQRYNERVLVG